MNKFISSIQINYIFLFIFAFAYIFVVATTSPLYPAHNSLDSNIYMVMGKGLFNNLTIYKDLFDHKGPLLYLIYGLGSLFPTSNFIGIYLVESINLFFCLFFAYKIALLYLNSQQALLICILFSVTLLTGIVGMAGSADEFTAPFITAGLYFYLSYFKQKSAEHPPRYMFYHGVSLMSVFLIKMTMITVWLALIPAIFIHLLLEKKYRNILSNSGAFILGLLAIFLPFLVYFLLTNSFHDFVDAYWKFNKLYASTKVQAPTFSTMEAPSSGPVNLVKHAYYLLRTYSVSCGCILLGAIAFLSKKAVTSPIGRFGILFSILFLFAASYIQRCYNYYFIPLCVFSILGYLIIFKIIEKAGIFRFSWKLWLGVMFTCLTIGFFRDKANLMAMKEKNIFQGTFSEIIKQESNPTVLALRFAGPYQVALIYNQLGIIPNVKYFYHPTISSDVKPEILATQVQYLKDKKCMFVCLSSYSDFEIPPTVLTDNYELVSKMHETEYFVSELRDLYFYLYKIKK